MLCGLIKQTSRMLTCKARLWPNPESVPTTYHDKPLAFLTLKLMFPIFSLVSSGFSISLFCSLSLICWKHDYPFFYVAAFHIRGSFLPRVAAETLWKIKASSLFHQIGAAFSSEGWPFSTLNAAGCLCTLQSLGSSCLSHMCQLSQHS